MLRSWRYFLVLLAFFAAAALSRHVAHAPGYSDLDARIHLKDIVVHGTEQSLTVPYIAKRATLSFEAARQKGCAHMARITTGNGKASIFTSPDALDDNGWDYDSGDTSGISLQADATGVFGTLGISTTNANNPVYDWGQFQVGVTSRPYGDGYPSGYRYGVTEGTYLNRINARAGLIFCEINYSPKYMVDKSGATGPVPPLNQFTDIVWFQWLDATADAGVDKKSVRYFYRYHIADTNSKAVIEEVLAMDGQSLLRFPGRTYTMTSDIGKALLGTPNGNGVAHFLTSHIPQLGRKTITKVQLFGTDPFFNMLFTITDL
ncbi:hypothetical protein Q7P35_011184 [Cladosporium inversicolor]